MIRILIVDDERSVVNHFSMLLEEDDRYEYDIMKAYSGVEALQLLRQTCVHIVLLDIQMPQKNGLEVAAEIKALWEKTRIIFLTAFDQFDYIYEANNLKGSSYLLKIESDDTVRAEIYRNIEEILSEQEQSRKITAYSRQQAILNQYFSGSILKDLFYGHSVGEIQAAFRASQIEAPLSFDAPVFLAIMEADKSAKLKQMLAIKDWMNYIEVMEQVVDGQFRYAVVEVEKNLYLWLIQPENRFGEMCKELEVAHQRAVLEDFQDLLRKRFHYDTKLILYPEAVNWKELLRVYELLYECNQREFGIQYRLQSVLITYDAVVSDMAVESQWSPQIFVEQKGNELKYYLNKGDFAGYCAVLEEICQEPCFQESGMRTNLRAMTCYMSVITVIMNFIEQNGLIKEISRRFSLLSLFQVEHNQNWQEVFAHLEKVSREIFAVASENKEDRRQKIISNIKLFIRDHLSENITLFSISQAVSYNESYISRIFKQHEGIGISEYLTMERVSYAKKLLKEQELSIQKVAAMAGFSTSQYFSVVFKKIVGITPAEYRR